MMMTFVINAKLFSAAITLLLILILRWPTIRLSCFSILQIMADGTQNPKNVKKNNFGP
jgi:hypothetical protein